MPKKDDTKSKSKSKPKPPKPEDVEPLTINDVVADHLGTKSMVVDMAPDKDNPEWRSVTFKRVTHNQWTVLSKTALDPDGTQEYFRKMIFYASTTPKFESELLHPEIDAGFVLNYGKQIEKYIGKMDFL